MRLTTLVFAVSGFIGFKFEDVNLLGARLTCYLEQVPIVTLLATSQALNIVVGSGFLSYDGKSVE